MNWNIILECLIQGSVFVPLWCLVAILAKRSTKITFARSKNIFCLTWEIFHINVRHCFVVGKTEREIIFEGCHSGKKQPLFSTSKAIGKANGRNSTRWWIQNTRLSAFSDTSKAFWPLSIYFGYSQKNSVCTKLYIF